jgi:hypothetical protein
VAEGASVPVEGWDFSWFEGRATEERPSWGYSSMMAGRMADASAALDIQTGGGEVLAEVPHLPRLVAATESWPPNLVVAAEHLRPRDAWVLAVADDGDLPFAAASFDLVVSRLPTVTRWDEVARVLVPEGTYLAQHVGAGTVRELTDFMMGSGRVVACRVLRHRRRRALLAQGDLDRPRFHRGQLPSTTG